jgi:hypothetical protein
MLGDCDLVYMAVHCRDNCKDNSKAADKLPRRPSSGRLNDMRASEAVKAARPSPGWLRLARTSSDNFS